MIGKRSEKVVNRAVAYAMHLRQEYFTVEHILLSLLKERDVMALLSDASVDRAHLVNELEIFLEAKVPKRRESTEASAEDEARSTPQVPGATLAVQRLFQRAVFQVQSSGRDEVEPLDLLVAVYAAEDSMALKALLRQGLERLRVIEWISEHRVSGDNQDEDSESSGEEVSSGANPDTYPDTYQDSLGRSSTNQSEAQGSTAKGSSSEKDSNNPLKQYTQNLNQWVREGRVDPLVGRERELERILQTLCRRRKNNPLLVGEAGVGKTAIAEGLATLIVEKRVPALLSRAEVYSLDMGALLAGAKFRGDFEQRLKRVIDALEKRATRGEMPILFIDEIHTVIGAGSVGGSSLDAANLLKPVLTRGVIRCMGSTTYAEFRNVFEKDHAMARRFQKIEVPEPSSDETFLILQGLQSKLESYHHVVFSKEVLKKIIELSVKHLTDRFLPDKAIDLMDELGARSRLSRATQKTAVEGPGVELKAEVAADITVEEVEDLVSQIARIPAKTVTISQRDRLKNLERELKLRIFGQDQAVEKLVASIRLARSGLRHPEKPIGNYLLVGPTGVGKTELSRQLAHCMGIPLLRFDMSEYSERHTVSRLIGAPPGYVGFDQAGLLTEQVLKNPHAVILLDEIEKAHPEVWNILLQVMDHGLLTDQNGRKVSFKNVVILLTSNVGSRELERKPFGLVTDHVSEVGIPSGVTKAVEQAFTPEFRNRLDAVVFFNPLSREAIQDVVEKQLAELESLLSPKKVELKVTAAAKDWLAQKGYSRELGARPMARLVQDEIKAKLANEILFGALEFGGIAEVDFVDGKLSIQFTSRAPELSDSQETESVAASATDPVGVGAPF